MRSALPILCAGLLGLASSASYADVEICFDCDVLTPEHQRERDEQERQRQEAIRKEQAQIDNELARRGWPRSREGEVRQYLELQKKAAALAPKAGAGAALRSASDVQDEWAGKREAANALNSTSPKSRCWEEEEAAMVAMGLSTQSEDDARTIALSKTHGCNLVGEMFCDRSRDAVFKGNGLAIDEKGNLVKGAYRWDCRVSYQCGKTVKRCENTPSAVSRQ